MAEKITEFQIKYFPVGDYIVSGPDDKNFRVVISEDLFETHRCSCDDGKKSGDCVHIQAVLENLKNKEVKEEKKEEKKENIIYLDLETQFLADEVGGWGNISKMKLAVAVIYSTRDNAFISYKEDEAAELVNTLKKGDLIVGFNIKRFDYTVLQPYVPNFSLSSLPTVDMLEDIYKKLGYRVSLNDLAKETLNLSKSADGLKSVEWFRNGEIQKVIDYCRQDVMVTKELFLFGRKYGHVTFFDKRSNKKKELKVIW